MTKENNRNGLHATVSTTSTYVFYTPDTLMYSGCPISADYSDFVRGFDEEIFQEVHERYKGAWERLANL